MTKKNENEENSFRNYLHEENKLRRNILLNKKFQTLIQENENKKKNNEIKILKGKKF